MGNYAIQVCNISKMYRIGAHRRLPYRALRETIVEVVSAPFRRAGQLLRGQAYGAAGLTEELWALKDITFDVEHGEVIGIIGPNGAGKSTLLKVLSRITKPTWGYADIRGRVGALLEVGTGFHPELTGRENIYLNGAILGMTRSEIEGKFEEIVDFAGVEKFLDTPVKHFSSGMALRLGFAVAAHLEPEIIVVDEVLAVGDMGFQQKCLGKMSDVASAGRTVLFVSHNLVAVNNLCSRAILLNSGDMVMDGPVDDVIRAYSARVRALQDDLERYPVVNPAFGMGFAYCHVELLENPYTGAVGLEIRLGVLAERAQRNIGIGFQLHTSTGVRVANYGAWITDFAFDLEEGVNHFAARCENVDSILTAGEYFLGFRLEFPGAGRIVWLDNAGMIKIPAKDMFGTGNYLEAHRNGPVVFPLSIQRSGAPD